MKNVSALYSALPCIILLSKLQIGCTDTNSASNFVTRVHISEGHGRVSWRDNFDRRPQQNKNSSYHASPPISATASTIMSVIDDFEKTCSNFRLETQQWMGTCAITSDCIFLSAKFWTVDAIISTMALKFHGSCYGGIASRFQQDVTPFFQFV